ncbi:MAG: aminotransferase class V-fold PLP-dependent enzyme [Candidatus Aminicenantes bacterium]|nr:aminotransferase class V-fold PLP-dependent enzyme [Candidatus Aminicenantes bacterium]
MDKTYNLVTLRETICGNGILYKTPFGRRHLLYADYTASGRGSSIIEDKMADILKSYANTHTEDDYTGKYSSILLKKAEEKIKSHVNAGPGGKIIATGSGTTGALKKLQEILGVTIPPAAKEDLFRMVSSSCPEMRKEWDNRLPVVFIGPYEHHTNELMWREALVHVEVIPFDSRGRLDLAVLEERLSDVKYKNRRKMGSFSAGSNITGIRTPVYDVARICHRHHSLVFFDFAAVAPYVEIDMNRDKECFFDAIFFSPHKFLGGPGTSGILVFNEKIYRKDLSPTTAGGGTVTFVGFSDHDFCEDIETREKAGTPPILQTIKAGLVLDLKEKIGVKKIEQVEAEHTKYFLENLSKIQNLDLVGDISSRGRVSIVSFNIKHKDRILHPKFVTRLMNDLFGLQSRAGCSCAGPYGHVLLGIDEKQSQELRSCILNGYEGLKPGWVRVNIHYTLSKEDINFLIDVIAFIARAGHLFLKKYVFNKKTGEWRFLDFKEDMPEFSLDSDFAPEKIDRSEIPMLRSSYFKEAEKYAANLSSEPEPLFQRDPDHIERLKYFYYVHAG